MDSQVLLARYIGYWWDGYDGYWKERRTPPQLKDIVEYARRANGRSTKGISVSNFECVRRRLKKLKLNADVLMPPPTTTTRGMQRPDLSKMLAVTAPLPPFKLKRIDFGGRGTGKMDHAVELLLRWKTVAQSREPEPLPVKTPHRQGHLLHTERDVVKETQASVERGVASARRVSQTQQRLVEMTRETLDQARKRLGLGIPIAAAMTLSAHVALDLFSDGRLDNHIRWCAVMFDQLRPLF